MNFYDQKNDTHFPNNSSANQVRNKVSRYQTMDDNKIKELMELLSERENDIRNLPNVNYWISDLYSQMKKYNAEIDGLKKCNSELNGKIVELEKKVKELNGKLENNVFKVLKQDRKDIQELQGKLKNLATANKEQVSARPKSSDKSMTQGADPIRKSEQKLVALIRDKQISANDARFETYRGPISDFCRDYNALFSLSGSQRQQARKKYLSDYLVIGASFDEDSGTLKETDIDRAEYYLYQRTTGVYEVVPTDKGKYEQEKHKRRGGESFFESNFDDYDSYSRIKVIAPAIFSADLSLRQKGKLQLS